LRKTRDVRRDTLARVYRRPYYLKRHQSHPLLQEREQFLTYLLRLGIDAEQVRGVGAQIVRGIYALDLREIRDVTPSEIDDAIKKIFGERFTNNPKPSFKSYPSAFSLRSAVRRFLRFHHRLKLEISRLTANDIKLAAFVRHQENHQYRQSTIDGTKRYADGFLKWLTHTHKSLANVSVQDFSHYFAVKKSLGWSPATLHSAAQSIKPFIRYCETRRWCKWDLSSAIRVPRYSAYAASPQARDWRDVESLLASLTKNDHAGIRARAALNLCAQYALRSGELARLRIQDFDWKKNVLTICREKNGCKQRYPLTRKITQYIKAYLKVRPPCNTDQLFLTIKTPYRPVRQKSFYSITTHRLSRIGINHGKRGTHAIRHACAIRLLRAGRSIKEIGRFLGHQHPESPLIYAKFDINLLRPVAEFRLRDLL
jgi:integrase/recombinase XerD